MLRSPTRGRLRSRTMIYCRSTRISASLRGDSTEPAAQNHERPKYRTKHPASSSPARSSHGKIYDSDKRHSTCEEKDLHRGYDRQLSPRPSKNSSRQGRNGDVRTISALDEGSEGNLERSALLRDIEANDIFLITSEIPLHQNVASPTPR